MSNNNSKPTSTVVKNPNNVVAAARAAEEAKSKVSNESAKAVGTPSVTNKAPEAPKTNVGTPSVEAKSNVGTPSVTAADTPKKKRLSRKDWIAILEKKEKQGLTADEIAEEYSVTAGNVYQWASKLKSEGQQQTTTNLSSNSLVEDAKKLLAGIDDELKAFDATIEEAKAKVANAKDERAKIEAKTTKYQTIIDLLGETKKN